MLINNSLPAYVLVRIAIFVLRSLAPISLIYCAALLFNKPLQHRWLLIFDLWMLVEAAFFLMIYVVFRTSSQRPSRHALLLEKQARSSLFNKCLENTHDRETYFSEWFLNSPASDVRRENVKEFYAWSILDKKYEDSGVAENEELDAYVDQLEKKRNEKFVDGWGKAQSLRLTLDGVPMQHRPLIWYTVGTFGPSWA